MSNQGNNSIAKEKLKSIIDRIELLENEKKAIGDDVKEVFSEAKGMGFDVKVIRSILRIRKQDDYERAEHEAMLDLYMSALGMQGDMLDDHDCYL